MSTFTLATSTGEAIIRILENDMIIPLAAIVFGCLVGIVVIIFAMVRSMVVSKAREVTKRELAAYVAEGTITPDQAVAIINAGKSADDCA